jgi:hypothetical protein
MNRIKFGTNFQRHPRENRRVFGALAKKLTLEGPAQSV